MSSSNLIPTIPAEEHARRMRRASSSLGGIWDLLDAVKDPEIPALSLWEMGILQDLEMDGDRVVVTITPTYSGCPAMSVMAEDLVAALEKAGYRSDVVSRLSPAWSTSWMSDEAKEKLRSSGIAPPVIRVGSESGVSCPRCGSDEIKKLSEFGTTACKALYQCTACAEPFDHFKPI